MSPLALDEIALPVFGLADDVPRMHAALHRHRQHQILYAHAGSLLLRTADAIWTLPPQRAAWIAGGTPHEVSSEGPVALRTGYLDEAFVRATAAALGDEALLLPIAGGEACRVFDLPELGRELMQHAATFAPTRGTPRLELARRHTFALVLLLVAEWAGAARPFALPRGRTAAVRVATDIIAREPARALHVDAVARAAGLSVRSLHRRLTEETGFSFRSYVTQARVLAAMAALADPDARVIEVALACGFESPGAFARAFVKIAGESPSAFRDRRRR